MLHIIRSRYINEIHFLLSTEFYSICSSWKGVVSLCVQKDSLYPFHAGIEFLDPRNRPA